MKKLSHRRKTTWHLAAHGDSSGSREAPASSSRAVERRRRTLVYRRRRIVVAVAVVIVVALVAWVWTLFGGAGQNPAPSSEPRKAASSARSSAGSRNGDSPKDDASASRQREREEEPAQENAATTPAPDAPLNDGGRQDVIAQAEQTAQANGKQVVRYTYCVASMGASVDMTQFENKVFHTLNDPKGWPRAGATFSLADQAAGQACDMTITLAEAQYLPSFSEGCSVEWSCRVGNNVIINVDRWNGATDSWNAQGGSIDLYRTMVINHEVGHRLGHYDNETTCPAPGQPAPLMQQQSIDMQGCVFNVYPLDSELWIA